MIDRDLDIASMQSLVSSNLKSILYDVEGGVGS